MMTNVTPIHLINKNKGHIFVGKKQKLREREVPTQILCVGGGGGWKWGGHEGTEEGSVVCPTTKHGFTSGRQSVYFR